MLQTHSYSLYILLADRLLPSLKPPAYLGKPDLVPLQDGNPTSAKGTALIDEDLHHFT